MVLRACYAMPGTEVANGTTRAQPVVPLSDNRHWAHAAAAEVSISLGECYAVSGIGLGGWYAAPGTERARMAVCSRKMMERSIKYSGRRSGHGTLSFTLITNSFIYGGESLLIDLPHHRMEGGSGEIFGITSSDTDAFTVASLVHPRPRCAVPVLTLRTPTPDVRDLRCPS